MAFASAMAHLRYLIALIFFVAANEEMIWIHAFGIIAFVAYKQTFRGATTTEAVCDSMRKYGLEHEGKNAVSLAVAARFPCPAFIADTLFNFLEKPINCKLVKILFAQHPCRFDLKSHSLLGYNLYVGGQQQ